MPTSSIYNGKLAAGEFYLDSERMRTNITAERADGSVVTEEVLTTAYPFFPHSYDQMAGAEKVKEQVMRTTTTSSLASSTSTWTTSTPT